MEMSNIVFQDADTSETTFPEGYPDLKPVPSPPTGQDDPSSENLEEVNHNILFDITPLPTLVDVPMTDQTPQSPNKIDTICNDLQAKLELDPEHLKIATIAAKYPPNAGAEHASSVFAMGAFNQLSVTRSLANVANHSYDSTFRDENSNDPPDPKPGGLLKQPPQTWGPGKNAILPCPFDKQPNDWKEDHLDPAQLQPNSEEGLKHY
ncbi:hypothetical protein PGT21_032167 [Puccinia graminis f. sp. tritici]|uniref:Uncharacterized protein n=1 Tax=Puccinia graminis f. sp. tritici TaxID=56615 RepID=A0A5B0P1P0_PUCGR|nr:hypothetical protein PGT21_032167 [Puccinia graminis f. sp. tritici]